MKNRILSIVITVSMVFGFTIPCFANDIGWGDIISMLGDLGNVLDAVDNDDYEGAYNALGNMYDTIGEEELGDAYRSIGDAYTSLEEGDYAGALRSEAEAFEHLDEMERKNRPTGFDFFGIFIGWDNEYPVEYNDTKTGFVVKPYGEGKKGEIEISLYSREISYQDFMNDEFMEKSLDENGFTRLNTVNENCAFPAIETKSAILIFNPYLDSIISIDYTDVGYRIIDEVLESIMASSIDYSSYDIVKKVQKSLNDNGYDCGTPDGSSGPRTQAAITKYYEDNGFEFESEINSFLLISLGINVSDYNLPEIKQNKF